LSHRQFGPTPRAKNDNATVDLYLGHTPASVKDKHYAAPPQELFDEAVGWLGKQLGQY
jgi:hypothetical protein